MSNDESLDLQAKQKQESISSEAEDWGRKFVTVLEHEYTDLASQLSRDASAAGFRRAMMKAVLDVFLETGASAEDIARLMEESSGRLSSWTTDDNARRMWLIERWLQRTITLEESIELGQLTARMRFVCDREEMVPLEGAMRLHAILSSSESKGGPA